MNINGRTFLDASAELEEIGNIISTCTNNIINAVKKINEQNGNVSLQSIKFEKSCNYMQSAGRTISDLGIILNDLGQVYDSVEVDTVGRSL